MLLALRAWYNMKRIQLQYRVVVIVPRTYYLTFQRVLQRPDQYQPRCPPKHCKARKACHPFCHAHPLPPPPTPPCTLVVAIFLVPQAIPSAELSTASP